jgi:hypothetical protein
VLGGGGRTVVGRIRTVPENAVQDWTIDLQKLVRQPAPVAPKRAGFPDESVYWDAWWNYTLTESRYYLVFKPDGSFVVDDVPPGDYKLELHLTEPRADRHDRERYMPAGREIGSLTKNITVPESPANGVENAFDLGTLTVELQSGSHASR